MFLPGNIPRIRDRASITVYLPALSADLISRILQRRYAERLSNRMVDVEEVMENSKVKTIMTEAQYHSLVGVFMYVNV